MAGWTDGVSSASTEALYMWFLARVQSFPKADDSTHECFFQPGAVPLSLTARLALLSRDEPKVS